MSCKASYLSRTLGKNRGAIYTRCRFGKSLSEQPAYEAVRVDDKVVRIRTSQISEDSLYHTVRVLNHVGTFRALVDTGATHSFIDVTQLNFQLPIEALPKPMELLLFGDTKAPPISSSVVLTLESGLTSPFSHKFLMTKLEPTSHLSLD